MSKEQEYRINELESEVKSLNKLLSDALWSLSIYRLTDSSRPNLKAIKLPGNIAHQAGYNFDEKDGE